MKLLKTTLIGLAASGLLVAGVANAASPQKMKLMNFYKTTASTKLSLNVIPTVNKKPMISNAMISASGDSINYLFPSSGAMISNIDVWKAGDFASLTLHYTDKNGTVVLPLNMHIHEAENPTGDILNVTLTSLNHGCNSANDAKTVLPNGAGFACLNFIGK